MFDAALVQLKDDMIAALCTNLRIQSDAQPPEEGKPNGPGPANALAHALRTAAQLGFVTKDVDGYAGYAEYGQGEEMIAVLGHLDVVPGGDGWQYPPYAGMIEDGRIYGRGTLDDKGPMFAALYALKAIMDSGLPLKRRIRLIFGTSEETGSADMAYYVTKEELPVAGFTPDSCFPLINAEKGILHVMFSKDYSDMADADVVLTALQAGNAINMVPDKATAVLAVDGHSVHLTSRGFSAHGSRPQEGQNACFGLLRLLARQDLPFILQDDFAFLTHILAHETAGINLGIACQDDASGPLTVNLGLLSWDGVTLQGGLDIRYPVTISKDQVLTALEAGLGQGDFVIDSFTHTPPLYVPADAELAKTLLTVYREKTGQDLPALASGGGTYARTMPNVLAFGPRFPGDPDLCHQPNEYIAIDRLVLMAQIFAQAMYALAK